MKTSVPASERFDLLASFPMEFPDIPGWCFVCRETSPGHYLAEGRDVSGRAVSRHGDDEHAVLETCLTDARAMFRATIVNET